MTDIQSSQETQKDFSIFYLKTKGKALVDINLSKR